MERDEVEQEMTDLLVEALEFQERPKAAMFYCRLALECQIHAKYHDQEGHFPDEDGFKDFTKIMGKIEQSLTTQTKEVLWSINAQTRGSMHWGNETSGNKGAKTRHVTAVVNQISATYQDMFGSELILTGLEIGGTNENIVKKSISKALTDLGIENDSKNIELPNGENLPNEEDLMYIEVLLDAAEAAVEKGIMFDPWHDIRLGLAAKLAGHLERAEGHYKQALRHFKQIGDRGGEAGSLNNLGIIAETRGDLIEAERLQRESLAIRREIGDRGGEADSLFNLGLIAETRGDLVEAERLHQESLAIMREIGDY